MGGSDELSNLVTLCDGCHAAHHPTLAGRLAHRVFEWWALRIARWLDRTGTVGEAAQHFGPALRLFNLDRFRDGQLPIILAALAGKSILVVSPTGSGKTLCFQLPGVLRRGVSVVVSPLKTLMSAQVSALLRKKIPATFINSDLAREEKELRLSLLSRGAFKFLYLAPERFFTANPVEAERLQNLKPAFLVVDEAHCIDQWGNDFRPEYGKLASVRSNLGEPPVLAFTATAGRQMQQRIVKSLGIPDAEIFVRDVDRPKIALVRRKCPIDRRSEEIAGLLRMPDVQNQKAMVFVPSTKVGEELKAELAGLGLDIPLFHGKLGTSFERNELLQRFMGKGEHSVSHIICTSAFGMGLDIPDIRLAIHWQQPASMEDLLQEFGRAGRDGKPAVALIFHEGAGANKDLGRLRFMADKTIEDAQLDPVTGQLMRAQRYGQIAQLESLLKADSCFRQSVREYFGEAARRPRRSIGQWIVELLFGGRATRATIGACCDYCDRDQLRRAGLRTYISAVVADRFTPTR